jgi:hypothetical protein
MPDLTLADWLMFSLSPEEEGLAYLYLTPPVSFPIWNVSEVQFQFRAPSRNLERDSKMLYRFLGYRRVWRTKCLFLNQNFSDKGDSSFL